MAVTEYHAVVGPRHASDYRTLAWAAAMPVAAVLQYSRPSLVPFLAPLSCYLALSAGIRIQAGFGGKAVQGGTPGGTWQGYSFNGGIAGSNATLVEGLALDMAQMNSPSFVPPADATQEFRAQTNKFSAIRANHGRRSQHQHQVRHE